MRTEKEIRAYRDALAVLNDQPCGCAGTEHEIKCVIGGLMMSDSVRTLTWVLGDDEEMAARVESVVYEAGKV